MVFFIYSSKICRKITCLSIPKHFVIAYSASAKPGIAKTSHIRKSVHLTDTLDRHTRDVIVTPSIYSKPKQQVDLPQDNALNIPTKGDNQEPEWRSVEVDFTKLHHYCLRLSKIRLTSLVVITAMSGYALAPGPFDVYTFAMASLGTGLVSAAANTINQFFEVPFDAQMPRTKNRVLVRGLLTPAQAVMFATISGFAGLSILYNGVNGVTALLGAINLILYTLIYTPMKRVSILNTWTGSVVGAIPPLMGWTSCVGDITTCGAWIAPAILYAWQFPHFNALSWNLKPEYSRAGYRMMAATNPDLCRRTAVRYTAAIMGLCYLAPVFDVTTWWFAAASTPLNAYFLYLAWEFNKHSDSASSRKLFRFSLIHLPLLMTLMLLNKKYWFIGEKNTDPALDQSTYSESRQNNVFTLFTRFITQTASSM